MAVTVQIFRTGVVPVGVAPALSLKDLAVTFLIPLVPLIAAGSVVHLVLWVVRSLNGDHLALLGGGRALLG